MMKIPPIAIVGIAGIFPGADDITAYWHNIVHRVDASTDVPPDRWIVPLETVVDTAGPPDKAFHQRACLIRDFHFDPGRFDLPADIANRLDPVHQLVLHVGHEALAGVKSTAETARLPKERTGVILAAIALPTDSASAVSRAVFESAVHHHLTEKTRGADPPVDINPSAIGNIGPAAAVTGLPAALLAAALGLGGGTYTLDAACASSLFSIKLACDELRSRRADMMLAGGVSRPDCLYTQIGFSQLRALSPRGRCSPFDADADGLVVGEGCGIFVLKRLDDARRDGDHIFGLIRGIGLSNDIGGNLLAPDAEGQIRAMRQAYQEAGWTPQDVDLIECHGAGTPVGDSVELQSLTSVWGEYGGQPPSCAIGSVKSMIGHLLTAAGAAGLIKVLLAMQHGVLPPTLHHRNAPPKSLLRNSPFRVQTEAAPWHRRNADTPRRAAVSAFGFGGINAHLLVEEWREEGVSLHSPESPPVLPDAPMPIAVIGMAVTIGPLDNLRRFQESVFNGRSAFIPRPPHRWKYLDAAAGTGLGKAGETGAFIDQIPIEIGRFHIPPNELPDILPQHLLMLKTAADAIHDAGLPHRSDRPRMGAVIGIDFDMEATNFHARWAAPRLSDLDHYPAMTDETERRRWIQDLKDAVSPPLTATRTLGALGSMVASRIAKEFRLGGPGFVVSCQEASGLKALEIAVRSLQQNETDYMLVGAVEMTGDLRRMILSHHQSPYSPTGGVRSFDRNADGPLPGEGAVALVLKPLDKAVQAGDRIYAVIDGIGGASGRTDFCEPSRESIHRALERCLQNPVGIDLFELQGFGDPARDRIEAEALTAYLSSRLRSAPSDPIAVGSLAPIVGHTGAVSGLASVLKACLCLYQEILPRVGEFVEPPADLWDRDRFFLPAYSQYWVRNRSDGPRRACVGAATGDGNCVQVLLSSDPSEPPTPKGNDSRRHEKNRPLGELPCGLFVITGRDVAALLSGLAALSSHQTHAVSAGLSIETAARRWFQQTENLPADRSVDRPVDRPVVAIVAENLSALGAYIAEAKEAVQAGAARTLSRYGGVSFSPEPIGPTGDIAFVFPGSGNHFIGMGREIGLRWPEVLRAMDETTDRLKDQMLPRFYVPQRLSWETGWEMNAQDLLAADPLRMIFGQVVYGGMMADLIRRFGIHPSAVIGYSLGETTGNFALGVWKNRGDMLARMRETDLFSTQLAGPCHSARTAWGIPEADPFNWYAAVINRPADRVREVLKAHPLTRLLIINTPEECVIGGQKTSVQAALRDIGAEAAVFIEGVVTVHCDAALPVQEAYRRLHLFPTSVPKGIRCYSCALGDRHEPTDESAAQSILDQALNGFDFPKTIRKAHADGVRVFLEMGPHHSCTRMIDRILGAERYLAAATAARGENEVIGLLKFLATLISEGIPANLSFLYGEETFGPPAPFVPTTPAGRVLFRAVGEILRMPDPPIPHRPPEVPEETVTALPGWDPIALLERQAAATAAAHDRFLDLSAEISRSYAETYAYQLQLYETLLSDTAAGTTPLPQPHPLPAEPTITQPAAAATPPAFSRAMCLEFATGSAETVLGAMFGPVDSYRARVRLPDEPLMLVDRILSIEAEKGRLGPGKIVTEHDVLPGAWYLDGDRAPVCISVEAGQADLFLCAYMGIDLQVKGERTYRLLDATVDFFRDLPQPGETIRYDIRIERFARQGETHLFFFHFDGYIGEEQLIRMRNGCAGFFTEAEVKHSGGILLTDAEKAPQPGRLPPEWESPVPMRVEQFDEVAVNALRRGDLSACFGPAFTGKTLSRSLHLPGGRMKLIDRILHLDPKGGRYGIGLIRAEADISPDDWFLTCHFVDDRVMPGTLMYECCAHTLRVFIQRMGWITDRPGAAYAPVIGVRSRLKCRGPVTPSTQRVVYQIEIKEIGYGPQPYVIADAHMFADGHHIVFFQDMALQVNGVTRADIDSLWRPAAVDPAAPQPIFDERKVLAFAEGKPSEAFGIPYQKFDSGRFIARLPRPPYSFLHRVLSADPPPWELRPGGWITAQYDVPVDAWYFKANRTPTLPLSILLEIALQPCGWLAAYAGSALKSENPLRFRNLGGKAELIADVQPGGRAITTRARLTKVSTAADMIIEHFDFELFHGGEAFYRGQTHFGFFTTEALATQVGIGTVDQHRTDAGSWLQPPLSLPVTCPLWPDDPQAMCEKTTYRLDMPAKALLMIDRITRYQPSGGPAGLGIVAGTKTVNPDEWFFTAHFYQDPVCPGSLGIESFLQLLRFAAIERWPHLRNTHRIEGFSGSVHEWIYRGQITTRAKTVTVEAMITAVSTEPMPSIQANGYLHVDGLCIYKMDHFGIRLVPLTGDA